MVDIPAGPKEISEWRRGNYLKALVRVGARWRESWAEGNLISTEIKLSEAHTPI
jgi:hypothetical protein